MVIKVSKTGFTPFQAVLTSLSAAALTLCIGADLFLLTHDRGAVSASSVKINLVMSLASMVVCVALIFKAGSVDMFSPTVGEDEDKQPAVRALRTYFCMIFSDMAGVLTLMLAGALVYENAGRSIMIFAPTVFVAAALIYFVRVSRIGLVDFSDNENEENDGFSDWSE